MTDQQPIKEDIVVKRIIDAPVELVWKAWTDPEYVMRWWGPSHYTSPSCRIDLREGGQFLFHMKAPENQGGLEHYSVGVYHKIVPHKLLEFTQSLADKDGNKVDPTSVGMPPDFPHEIHTEITFHAIRPDMTELTIIERDWTMGQMAVYSYAGMQQSIDKLADSLRNQ
ncbi:MAG TPA: SRPBCC domain-containing protein [Anaerolineales bacterium]|nr:SRPBCC domain-containing protein [Anaerolineales bacterium]